MRMAGTERGDQGQGGPRWRSRSKTRGVGVRGGGNRAGISSSSARRATDPKPFRTLSDFPPARFQGLSFISSHIAQPAFTRSLANCLLVSCPLRALPSVPFADFQPLPASRRPSGRCDVSLLDKFFCSPIPWISFGDASDRTAVLVRHQAYPNFRNQISKSR